MEYLTEFFLPVALWFQRTPTWVTTGMKGVTFLGNVEFYLLVMPLLYWCIDIALGIRIGIILLLSGGINSILKMAFHSPRPFWVSPQVIGLTEEVSFGFPSGHAQNAASVWGLLAASRKNNWITAAALITIFLIGLSRLVLGAHFLHDVLAGWLIGGLILFLFLRFENKLVSWFNHSPVWKQVAPLGITALVLIMLAVPFSPPFNPPVLPAAWLLEVAPQENPYSYNELLNVAGSLLGLGFGVILLSRRSFFKREGSLWQLILRYLVGITGVLILYAGLGAVFPDNLNLISYLLRLVRYSMIGFWISIGAPQVFALLKLTEIQTA
jgi:membrane-associated phospholipid phosphatase